MILLFSKLLIAHLIGDFILLPGKRLKEKGRKLWKSRLLIAHAIIHAGLAWLLTFNLEFVPFALLIGFSHYAGDMLKGMNYHKHPAVWYLGDQIFHVVLLLLIAFAIVEPDWNLRQLMSQLPWVGIAGLLAVTFPAASLISMFLSQWPVAKSLDKIKGLTKAGLYIGIMERVMIFIFVVSGRWEGIGFLLAAKSIFRFGDLTNHKEMHLTEYIMVGTLLSFCIAIMTGLIVLYFGA